MEDWFSIDSNIYVYSQRYLRPPWKIKILKIAILMMGTILVIYRLTQPMWRKITPTPIMNTWTAADLVSDKTDWSEIVQPSVDIKGFSFQSHKAYAEQKCKIKCYFAFESLLQMNSPIFYTAEAQFPKVSP